MEKCCICGNELKDGEPQYRNVLFHFEGIFGQVVKTSIYCSSCYENLTKEDELNEQA